MVDELRVVLIGTDSGPHGGVQRYTSAIFDALHHLSHQPAMILTSSYSKPCRRLRAWLRATAAIARADVVWIAHPRLAVAILPAAIVLRRPSVVSTYGFETWGKYSWLMRAALRRSNAVTVISMFSWSMMGSVAPSHTFLLRPPLVLGPTTRRARMPLIAMVARLDDRYKGLDTLLAVADLCQDLPYQFVFAGPGKVPDDLVRHAARLPNVENAGFIDDRALEQLYESAAVLLVPTRAPRTTGDHWIGGEGFGMVIAEAAQRALPVLASDEGACPETIAITGNGRICRPTAEAFESSLRDLLAQPECLVNLGEQGLRGCVALAPDNFEQQVAKVISYSRAANEGKETALNAG